MKIRVPREHSPLGEALLYSLSPVANLIKPLPTIVNYDSRVAIWGIFKSGTTLES